MIKSIIQEAVVRALAATNAEEYLIRLRRNIESDIRHQIKLHGGRESFDVNTRFSLGFNGEDGFFQTIRTNIINVKSGEEIADTVKIPIHQYHMLGGLRGAFHHASIKAKLANDYYFAGGEIHTLKSVLENELKPLFGNHKVIIAVNHARKGDCAVDVELIQCSLKSLADMFSALESGLSDDAAVA